MGSQVLSLMTGALALTVILVLLIENYQQSLNPLF